MSGIYGSWEFNIALEYNAEYFEKYGEILGKRKLKNVNQFSVIVWNILMSCQSPDKRVLKDQLSS